MTIITLTTDFGSADGYVGTMKGVILGIAPNVRLVDLSHEIAAQNVRGAEYVLGRAAASFRWYRASCRGRSRCRKPAAAVIDHDTASDLRRSRQRTVHVCPG